MSTLITWEWGYLLTSMMWGMVLAGCYDIIRVFRRVVVHRGVRWIFAEDMVYWMCSGFVIFHVTFLINDGIIRSFSIAGLAMGAAIYRVATHNWLVDMLAACINFLLIPLKMLVRYFKMLFSWIFKVKVTLDEKVRDKTGKTGETEETETL